MTTRVPKQRDKHDMEKIILDGLVGKIIKDESKEQMILDIYENGGKPLSPTQLEKSKEKVSAKQGEFESRAKEFLDNFLALDRQEYLLQCDSFLKQIENYQVSTVFPAYLSTLWNSLLGRIAIGVVIAVGANVLLTFVGLFK